MVHNEPWIEMQGLEGLVPFHSQMVNYEPI